MKITVLAHFLKWSLRNFGLEQIRTKLRASKIP